MAKTSALSSISPRLNTVPAAKPALPALEMAKNAATLPERLRLLLANDPAKDKAAAFLWPFLALLWNYAAERIGEVADDAPSIDDAMRAGFNWELGPFEMWDAAGVADTVARMKALHLPVSAPVQALLASSRTSWYSPGNDRLLPAGNRPIRPHPRRSPATPASPIFAARTASSAPTPALRSSISATASACIELHSLKNAIGGDLARPDLRRPPSLLRCDPRLCRLRHLRRPRKLQRRRQPDATPARRAGRRMGRAGCTSFTASSR